jgi:hypothetical protein
MDGQRYREILNNNLLKSARQLRLNRNFIFQQDNDPKHIANLTKAWLHSKKLNGLQWPSQSPDLNPIENLWTTLKKLFHQRSSRNFIDLKQICKEEWATISEECCKKLTDTYRKRLQAVIDNKGYATKY